MGSEGASKGVDDANTPDVTPRTPPHLVNGGGAGAGFSAGGQTTPPSPFTDTSSSALALTLSASASAVSAGTPHTDLTSLPSDVSKLSLGLVAKKPPPRPEPPAVSWPYSHSAALDDIPGIAYTLDTFLKSQMVESEEYCHRNDPNKCVFVLYYAVCGASAILPLTVSFRERLYFAAGFGLIQCVKALMSYEDDVRSSRRCYQRLLCASISSYIQQDLLSAMGHTKHGNTVANEHRKKAASLPFRLAGYVTGNTGANWVKSMTDVERHAELVYAESLFEKV